MALEYRFIQVAYTDQHNRCTLDSLIFDLLTQGFYGPLPVPNRSTIDVGPEKAAWGGYLYPEFRIMAPDGKVISVGDPPMGTFAHRTPHAQAEAICTAYTLETVLPEFEAPKASDVVAVVMADSRWCPPFKWAQNVIDRNYDVGLRFFSVSYNLLDACEGCDPDTAVFYTVDHLVDTDFVRNTHTNALVLWTPSQCAEERDDSQ
jgi:hypothetical protein